MQKEKVKVYIDEKYHHATDPSIRPKSNADGDKSAPAATGTSAGIEPRTPNDEAAASKASTLVRKDAPNEPKSGGDGEEQSYGKDIKDIPR